MLEALFEVQRKILIASNLNAKQTILYTFISSIDSFSWLLLPV